MPKESFIYSYLYPKTSKFDSKGIEKIKMGLRIEWEMRMTGRQPIPNHFRLSVTLDRDIPRGGWLLWVFMEPTVRPFCSLFVHLTKPQLYSLRILILARPCASEKVAAAVAAFQRSPRDDQTLWKIYKIPAVSFESFENTETNCALENSEFFKGTVELATYENRVATSRLINESLNKNIYSLLLYQFLESQHSSQYQYLIRFIKFS